MAPVLRLGIAGLGVASTQVLPGFDNVSGKVRLAGAADVRKEALSSFASKYPSVKTFDSIEALCASPEVDAIWVATPNHLHVEHSMMAAAYRKHIICEKPMAVTLEQCDRMAEAAKRNGVKFVQGHSKIYGEPIKKMRDIIKSGRLGRIVSIHTWNFNDWLVRPLTASEVDTDLGSGVVFRQGPHHGDIVRFLGGGLVRSVRATAGRWAEGFRKTEGDYNAFLEFEDGTSATMIFNGYGYFDITELTWGIGEDGRTANSFAALPRRWPSGPVSAEEKYRKVAEGDPYGSKNRLQEHIPKKQPFFGLTMVSCEKGVIRQSPEGLYVYTQVGREEVLWEPLNLGRGWEMLELYQAIQEDRDPFLDAYWGKATLELCLAILRSSQERREIMLEHQVACKEITGW